MKSDGILLLGGFQVAERLQKDICFKEKHSVSVVD